MRGQSLREGPALCPLAAQGGTGSTWRRSGWKREGKPEHATGAEREGCEGKGGQEPRVRLQSFNEKENFSCQRAHLILFPNVKPKAERRRQGGTADGSRVPVLCSRLAYPKMPGPQQACAEPVPSWAEALSPSAAVFQPLIRGHFRSPGVPGLHTLPAGLSGWAHSPGLERGEDAASSDLVAGCQH